MRTIVALSAAISLAAPMALAQNTPPIEQRGPNAPGQSPAFPGQTRAPQSDVQPELTVETVAEALPVLWSMEFLPDGRMLVATKAGAMHIVDSEGNAGPAIGGVPEVDARRQGGLLDLALSPDFGSDNRIYFSFSEPRGNEGNGTSVARATLDIAANTGSLNDVEVIFRQTPSYRGSMHYGSRLAFAPDGTLFIGTGERSDRGVRGQSQDLSSGLGKVFRINADGSIPQDNPFVGQAGAQPAIWSYGHRNIQSAVITDDGVLWTVEHGPRGGDELNNPQPGVNYGWPVITYGVEYSGNQIGQGITQAQDMAQPNYYWDPVIAPSGMAEYRGDLIPEWDGALLVGGLVAQGIVVLHMDGGRVAREDRVALRNRIRDVKVGPDGAVYAVTTSRGGGGSMILRVAPARGA